ncbi:peptidase family C54-domain-containing protein [Mycena rebaudengoi]|nr:peptidase family C54-domain-containing protein [Mycena rebaudengoi]
MSYSTPSNQPGSPRTTSRSANTGSTWRAVQSPGRKGTGEQRRGGGTGGSTVGGKTSLLDKAVRYLLDGDGCGAGGASALASREGWEAQREFDCGDTHQQHARAPRALLRAGLVHVPLVLEELYAYLVVVLRLLHGLGALSVHPGIENLVLDGLLPCVGVEELRLRYLRSSQEQLAWSWCAPRVACVQCPDVLLDVDASSVALSGNKPRIILVRATGVEGVRSASDRARTIPVRARLRLLFLSLHPAFPAPTPRAHAVHARLLSWFLNSLVAPFGVHRMALAGKAQGKDVGMWFGPSAAAGAVRTLVDAFPACGLGVSVATDGTLCQTEVYAASHTPVIAPRLKSHHSHGSQASHTSYTSSSSRASSLHAAHASSSSHASHVSYPNTSSYAGSKPAATTKRWGDRPMLLLLGIRLGLDSVNPVYYETIKMLYTFLQSVGVAGRRAILPRPAPLVSGGPTAPTPHSAHFASSMSEPPASRAGSQEPRAGSLEPRAGSLEPACAASPPMTENELVLNAQRAEDAAEENTAGIMRAEAVFYQRVYAPAELRTFHCEKVRKMPLSGLDPSMLLGFVCRDEGEWVDLRRRIVLLPRTIFAIQDELPTWPGADDDDNMGLESVSDPEEEEAVDVDDGEGSMRFFDEALSNASHGVSSSASHTHASTHYHSNSNSTTSSARTRNEEANDTEEDPVAAADHDAQDGAGEKGTAGSPFLEEEDGFVDAGREDDIKDDWVDPVPPPPPVAAPVPAKKSKSASGKGKEGKEKKEKGSKTKKAAVVPVLSVHYPFPQQQRAEEWERERQRNVTVSPRPTAQGSSEGQCMHTARAHDGGRTQSGGVRGVLTTDD